MNIKHTKSEKANAESLLKRLKKYDVWLEYLNENPKKLEFILAVYGSPENLYKKTKSRLTRIIQE